MDEEIAYRYYTEEEGMVYDIKCAKGVLLNDYLNSLENLMVKVGVKDKYDNNLYKFDVVKHYVDTLSEPILKVIELYNGAFIARPFDEESSKEMAIINFKTNHTMELVGNIFEYKEFVLLND